MGPQLRFSDGKAIQFCAHCLRAYGYPSQSELHGGRGARQSVTTIEGNSLCEVHFRTFTPTKKEGSE